MIWYQLISEWGQPHVFTLGSRIDQNEIEGYCIETFGLPTTGRWSCGRGFFRFRDNCDAVLFRLRWDDGE